MDLTDSIIFCFFQILLRYRDNIFIVDLIGHDNHVGKFRFSDSHSTVQDMRLLSTFSSHSSKKNVYFPKLSDYSFKSSERILRLQIQSRWRRTRYGDFGRDFEVLVPTRNPIHLLACYGEPGHPVGNL